MNEPRVNFSTNGAKAPIPSTSASTPVCPVVMPGRHQRCWQPSANISEMAPASSPEKLWRETRGNLVVNFTDKSHFLLEPVLYCESNACGKKYLSLQERTIERWHHTRIRGRVARAEISYEVVTNLNPGQDTREQTTYPPKRTAHRTITNADTK
jgi:hypothetical protein